MSEKTIGNPLSWIFGRAGKAEAHLEAVVSSMAGDADGPATAPEVKKIGYNDVLHALRLGMGDFTALRSDVIFLVVLYPVIGMFLFWAVFNGNLLALLAPVVSGFALVGPVAAIGLYELSRRREKGLNANWSHAFEIIRSPSFGAIIALGLFLGVVFVVWIVAAGGIYQMTMGAAEPESLKAFIVEVLTSRAGWSMAITGVIVGFFFALLVLAISVVSFPLLLDRNVGLAVAVATSVNVMRVNPGPIAFWGMIVAGSLAVGSIPALLGLVFVVPILGHSTWHLYRLSVK